MSPSTLQTLQDCPLRWMLERHGGRNAGELRSTAGSLIHALIAQRGRSLEQLQAELETVWPRLPFESEWFSRNELERHRAMLATFMTWREDTRRELTEVGTEVDVDGVLPAEDATGGADRPAVRVRGRIDRLERDAEGRLVVVDVKTGKSRSARTTPSGTRSWRSTSWPSRQGLASEDGAPGGGRLVYVGKAAAGGATEREQDAQTPDAANEWRNQVVQAAAATAGPQFVARVNARCAHCPVRPSCPAHRTGQETS